MMRQMRFRAPFRGGPTGAVLGLALVFALSAEAQHRDSGDPFAPLGIEQLADLSTSVVAGTIEAAVGEWNYDRTRIHTRFTLAVDRVLAGRASGTVHFRVLGGTVGDTTVMVSEMPRFQVGERVVVFLRGRPGRLPSVVGGPEGKISLDRSAGPGEPPEFLHAPLRAGTREDGEPEALLRGLDDLEDFLETRRRN